MLTICIVENLPITHSPPSVHTIPPYPEFCIHRFNQIIQYSDNLVLKKVYIQALFKPMLFKGQLFFPTLQSVGSNNTPAGQGLVNQFTVRAVSLGSTKPWYISRVMLLPSLVGNLRGSGSSIYYENQVKLLEVNVTKLRGSSCDWVPLESLGLRVVHTEPPVTHLSQFRSSYWFLLWFPRLSLFSSRLFSALVPLFLQSWGQQFASCSHLS